MSLINYDLKKLFLDDIREIKWIYGDQEAEEFEVVRSFKEFVEFIKENGLPAFISFDNDLGLDENGDVAPDGYAAAKWLVYVSGQDLGKLKFNVHLANPVAAEQIRGLLNNYMQFLKRR